MDASLRMLGLKPDAFASFDPERPLEVERLTVVGTDRFRPELLQAVRAAMPQPQPQAPATRKVFVSRAKARGRHLVGEQALWPALQRRGFERVCMEDLAFEAQVRLMQQTRVLLAPHGAGLTNMLFCPSAAEVLEIADPGYPNPNFYAMAAALGHGYWLIEGRGVGEGHALQRDLEVAPEAVRAALDRLEAEGVA
jgi:capsular polysaccharide biosynthesis protein